MRGSCQKSVVGRTETDSKLAVHSRTWYRDKVSGERYLTKLGFENGKDVNIARVFVVSQMCEYRESLSIMSLSITRVFAVSHVCEYREVLSISKVPKIMGANFYIF